jgi:hypothetical protein
MLPSPARHYGIRGERSAWGSLAVAAAGFPLLTAEFAENSRMRALSGRISNCPLTEFGHFRYSAGAAELQGISAQRSCRLRWGYLSAGFLFATAKAVADLSPSAPMP